MLDLVVSGRANDVEHEGELVDEGFAGEQRVAAQHLSKYAAAAPDVHWEGVQTIGT